MTRTPGRRRKQRRQQLPSRLVLPASGALVLVLAATATVTQPDRTLASSQGAAPVPTPATRFQSDVERRRDAMSRDARRPEAPRVDVERLARQRAASLAKLDQQAAAFARLLKENQWVLPLASYDITATFGQASYLWSSTHTGLDFSAPEGTTILAVAGGTVTSAGWSGAYGQRTVVRADDGTEFWYCHQSLIQVASGQQVRAGDRIGAVGSTGNVTGPHLHLEIRPGGGGPVDPMSMLGGEGLAP